DLQEKTPSPWSMGQKPSSQRSWGYPPTEFCISQKKTTRVAKTKLGPHQNTKGKGLRSDPKGRCIKTSGKAGPHLRRALQGHNSNRRGAYESEDPEGHPIS
ncbi:UNVERIFIED_CONTAM: hypothetical protein Sindi_3035800, partial [Sesamum indicum]